jgi:hypothetical protein
MDKILAILGKAKSSLTMWLGVAVVFLGQIQPVADFFASIVNKVAPTHAAAATAVLLMLGRLRTLITSALSSMSPPSA